MSFNRLTLGFRSVGNPLDVIELFESKTSELKSNDILIQMVAAPINPADINMLEGTYFIKPSLPAECGNEGVGKVIQVGPKADKSIIGRYVMIPFRDPNHWVGCWSTLVTIPEDQVVVLPDNVDPIQASMWSVNPITAYQMLQESGVRSGQWIVHNAANSGVGLWLVHFAKKLGCHVISICRSITWKNALIQLGADVVLEDNDSVLAAVKSLDVPVQVAFDCVGGNSANRLLRMLSTEGQLMTYGAMSQQPIEVGGGRLIFKGIRISGFNRTHWVHNESPDIVREAYKNMQALGMTVEVPIDSTFLISNYHQALKRALESQRQGKVLFMLNDL